MTKLSVEGIIEGYIENVSRYVDDYEGAAKDAREAIAERYKSIRAEGWDEGFTACDNWDAASMSTIPKNPYRSAS